MKSPCLPVACPARAQSSREIASKVPPPRRARRPEPQDSEISGKLEATRADRGSSVTQARAASRRGAGMRLCRAAAEREVQHGAEHEPRATHRKSDGRDVAIALG